MADLKEENSYRNILKRISAFGGVQVFNIIINLIRGKFVAVFLGAEGMGISSLLSSATNTIQQFAGLGLNLALVKEVAANKEDSNKLSQVVAVTVRLILFTSLLGAAVCGFAAPLWGRWTFGDYSYTGSFILLSVAVALSIGGSGYLALLQGLGSVKRITKASLVGGLTGLFCGVPIYWLFGINGIVPAMIILSLAVFLFYFISFKSKTSTEIQKSSFEWSKHKSIVKKLISLGLLLMIGSLVGTLVNYLINLFVRFIGSVEDVGLFQAANSLTNQYVGIIFSALAMDYFPRLSAVANKNSDLADVVNRQIEIVMLITTPLVILLIISTPLVIRLLLTEEFLCITSLMRWMGLGMLIQALAFPIGYIYIAKEDRKAYIWMEVAMSNCVWIISSILFYFYFGLLGLGISLVARGVLDLIINCLLCRFRYGFIFNSRNIRIIFLSVILGVAGFFASMCDDSSGMIISLLIFILSVTYSFLTLRKTLKSTR